MSIIDRRDPLSWPIGHELDKDAKRAAWKRAVANDETIWGFGEWCEEFWVDGQPAYEEWCNDAAPKPAS